MADEPESLLGKLMSHYREVVPVVVGGLLAILASVAVSLLQQRSERALDAARVRQAQVAEAVEAFRVITEALDGPTTAGRIAAQALSDSISPDSLERVVASHSAALVSWRQSLQRTRILTWVYFGDSIEAQIVYADSSFEKSQSRLAEMVGFIRAGERARRLAPRLVETDSLVASVHALRLSAGEGLRLQTQLILSLERMMASLIRSRQVGAFDPLAPRRGDEELELPQWPLQKPR